MAKQSPAKEDDSRLASYHNEIQKAGLRVGQSEADQVNWFLNFAQCDLAELSQGQLTDLGYEINWWVDSVSRKELPSKRELYTLSRLNWSGEPRFSEPGSEWYANMLSQLSNVPLPMDCLSFKEIQKLQIIPSYIVKELKVGKIDINLPGVRVLIPRDRKNAPLVTIELTEYPHYQVQRKIGTLWLENVARLYTCPECSRVFLADRKNKIYCSPRCQTTVATRKFRSDHSGKKGTRGRPKKVKR